jgi:hypothetical protein
LSTSTWRARHGVCGCRVITGFPIGVHAIVTADADDAINKDTKSPTALTVVHPIREVSVSTDKLTYLPRRCMETMAPRSPPSE